MPTSFRSFERWVFCILVSKVKLLLCLISKVFFETAFSVKLKLKRHAWMQSKSDDKEKIFYSISDSFIIIDKSITDLRPDDRVKFVHRAPQSPLLLCSHSGRRHSAAASGEIKKKKTGATFPRCCSQHSTLTLAARWRRPLVITTRADGCFSIKIIKIILQTYCADAFRCCGGSRLLQVFLGDQ